MAYKTNSIGVYEFAILTGQPSVRQMAVEVIERAAIDDVALRQVGQRARPFEMVSHVSAADRAAGRGLLNDYRDLITAASTHKLVVCDLDYDTLGLRVRVLSVEQSELMEPASMVGDLAAPADTVWLAAKWQLQFFPYTAP